MAEFRMPSLGADMAEGTLLRWFVHPGQTVHRGDIVAEVDTTKAAIEVECFDDGVVGALLVPEGETVPVGAVLATIDTDASTRIDTATQAPTDTAQAPTDATAQAPTAPNSTVRATPLVRRLADEAGLDLARVHGSGPAGRVLRADVEREAARRTTSREAKGLPTESTGKIRVPTEHFVRASGYARRLAADADLALTDIVGSGPNAAVRAVDLSDARARTPVTEPPRPEDTPVPQGAPADTAPSHRADPDAVRALVAAAMTRSKRTVPHYYLSSTIDLAVAVEWLRERNRRVEVSDRMLVSALLLCATARAAERIPELNGHWVEDEFRPAAAVHLGVVVSVHGGIVLPTIPDADTLSPPAMTRALREIVTRARAAHLRAADTVPATITVTNLGDLGVDAVFGVVPVPQVAIVGFGAVSDRPCAVGGMLGVRPQVCATLSADHRASDGALGARLLNTVAESLRHPEEL
ncbi:2-oxo acid dehydrogenase subunit E2 [Nocardia takedensis]|uniref:2-oxo acid dehydrogenase subunit E2 n=1 Tax=Nocardia takedensis TaxID=259390 RepID=UPI000314BD97|nr:2-oxo acid dehydrogenase subunit E2 [Nocardia takedensis]